MKKRSIFYLFLPLLLLIAAFSAAPSAAAEEAPYVGDLNGDQVTSAADAAMMLRGIAFARLSEEKRPDLDFTRNGEIDGTDVRAALFYACGGISDWVSFGERISSGLCDERLFDRFSYTGVQDDGRGNYKSANVSVHILSGRAGNSNYHVADIYVQDITCFATAFGREKFRGGAESVRKIFDSVSGGIVAMNGDFYSIHLFGPVVRNGEVFLDRVTKDWDIAVLQSDGVLVTYKNNTLTKDLLSGMNAYQTWVFGPALLDENGQAKTKFRSRVQVANPRTALGYFEPGHYAFIAVDGRSRASNGMTMQELSQFCQDLGLVSAYNMDGGQSSVLLAQDGVINVPYRDGRAVSDILVIRELPEG
ncbi:MAG: phosphodiester glycosidase family protein [Eubacteriales bacterium]|nr:phosphodiester glycosidase family protein [Eubacteriales bacterium]